MMRKKTADDDADDDVNAVRHEKRERERERKRGICGTKCGHQEPKLNDSKRRERMIEDALIRVDAFFGR
jgi:hypothetical protein